MYVCVSVCMHACMHACMHVCVYTYYVCTYIHIYIYIHTKRKRRREREGMYTYTQKSGSMGYLQVSGSLLQGLKLCCYVGMCLGFRDIRGCMVLRTGNNIKAQQAQNRTDTHTHTHIYIYIYIYYTYIYFEERGLRIQGIYWARKRPRHTTDTPIINTIETAAVKINCTHTIP